MNTLNNHTLLYDTKCPLCNLYTSGFISTKMLDVNGRKAFEKLTTEERTFVDIERAANEIALVDKENKKVIYGIDSLLKVIGNSYPMIERIGKVSFIHFGLTKLYSFVSYNRKVIMPSEVQPTKELTCVPSFNLTYRLLFILISVFITGYSLFSFSNLISDLPKTSFQTELFIAAAQIIFQSLFLLKKDAKTIMNYAGNLMTISLIGCIGLFQLQLLNMIIPLSQTFIIISFFGIVSLMFFEHKRRVKLLELPSYLSYTWVLYRIIVLLVLLFGI
ncbi:hypothetical protein [Tenacibaculum sp. M341]|uniref:hypothetical protein n=1 Tax=Tenacibaculum sp. M341 TaxID=2530339 RepID=UPI001053B90F|nr:hypothetical protein [Tenacibaculum sp. M341]TCI85181.1 hypothetical protein EYW44_17885 [Tenacibaculum sp. M341]